MKKRVLAILLATMISCSAQKDAIKHPSQTPNEIIRALAGTLRNIDAGTLNNLLNIQENTQSSQNEQNSHENEDFNILDSSLKFLKSLHITKKQLVTIVFLSPLFYMYNKKIIDLIRNS